MIDSFRIFLVQHGYGQRMVDLLHKVDPTWSNLLPARDSNGQPVATLSVWDPDDEGDEGNEEIKRNYSIIEGIAVIPIRGAMVANETWWTRYFEIPSYEGIRNDVLTALEDGEVHEILFDVSTPGGMVSGISDLSDLLSEAKQKKPIYTHASGDMMSAGMWLFSGADRVWASRTSMIGSIGAILVHMSVQKMLDEFGIKVTEIKSGEWKAVGSPYKNLTSEEKQYLQDRIDNTAQLFYDQMVINRPGIDRNTFDGSVYLADESMTKGMIDGVQSFDKSVREILARRPDPVVSTNQSGVYAAESVTGEVIDMKNGKKAMTEPTYEERKAAALAAGADPEKVDEILAAEDEKRKAEGAEPKPEANGDDTKPEANGGDAKPEANDGGDDAGDLTLEEAGAQIEALNTELVAAKQQIEALEAEKAALVKATEGQTELLEKAKVFMVERLTNMRLALGLTKIDFSDMEVDQVAREYESTNTMFGKAFNLANKQAAGGDLEDVDPDNKAKAGSVTSLQQARLRAAGLKSNK